MLMVQGVRFNRTHVGMRLDHVSLCHTVILHRVLARCPVSWVGVRCFIDIVNVAR
jgi:hypothetical protein